MPLNLHACFILRDKADENQALPSSRAPATASALGPAKREVKVLPENEKRRKTTGIKRIVPAEREKSVQERAADLRCRRKAFVAAAAAAAAPLPSDGAGDANQQQEDGTDSGDSSSPCVAVPVQPASTPAATDSPRGETPSASSAVTASASTQKSTPQEVSTAASEELRPSSPEATTDAITDIDTRTTTTPSAPPATVPPTPSTDLPGWMQLGDLLDLLASGPRPAYEALRGIACVDTDGNDLVWRSRGMGPAGPETAAGVCRRWWDAAWGAGEVEAAFVAADVLVLHLDAMQVNLLCIE